MHKINIFINLFVLLLIGLFLLSFGYISFSDGKITFSFKKRDALFQRQIVSTIEAVKFNESDNWMIGQEEPSNVENDNSEATDRQVILKKIYPFAIAAVVIFTALFIMRYLN